MTRRIWHCLMPDQLLGVPFVVALLGGAGAVMLLRRQRIIAGALALLLWLLGIACSAILATRRKWVSAGFAVALVCVCVSLAVGAWFVP
jgi:hypothetical protein